jgi:hypothetical protein
VGLSSPREGGRGNGGFVTAGASSLLASGRACHRGRVAEPQTRLGVMATLVLSATNFANRWPRNLSLSLGWMPKDAEEMGAIVRGCLRQGCRMSTTWKCARVVKGRKAGNP